MFGKIHWNDETKWFVAAMVMGGLWLISFNLATNIFVIASMAATWYFSQSDGINFWTGFCWAYTYHIGSLAFGSFIVALIWFI